MTYALVFVAGMFSYALPMYLLMRGTRRRHYGPPIPLSASQVIEARERGIISKETFEELCDEFVAYCACEPGFVCSLHRTLWIEVTDG